jgi:hypothetical protein
MFHEILVVVTSAGDPAARRQHLLTVADGSG